MKLDHIQNEEQATSKNYTVLPISQMFDKTVLEGQQDTPLTSQDIETIDQLMHQAIQSYNERQIAWYNTLREEKPNANLNKDDFLIDLTTYKRQYFCAANNKGEKEVWANCFCHEIKWWETGLVFYLDGGKCYFQMTLNIHTREVLRFQTNGQA